MKIQTHINKTLIILPLVLALLVPVLAFASPVIRSGDTVAVEADQFVEADFYASGEAVTISGSVGGDAYIAGGTVTVNAPVSEDLVVAAGTMQLHGSVGDDVRIAAGEVIIADSIEGDLVVLSGVLRVLSTATIGGDLLVAGGDVEITGTVEGSIYGYVDSLRVDGVVGDAVTISTSEALVLGDRAEVGGDIAYTSPAELIRAQGASVAGEIRHTTKTYSGGESVQYLLVPFFMSLFAALVLMVLVRRNLERFVTHSMTHYGTQGLIGLGVLLGMPVIALILAVSVLGFWLGIALLGAYLLLLMLAWIVTGVLVGSAIMHYAKGQSGVTLTSVIVGVAVVELVTLIPILGFFTVLAIFLISLGGIAQMSYRRITE